MKRCVLVLTGLSCLPAVPCLADVKAAPIFGDGMVLQRDFETQVWGTASPGEKLTVELCGRRSEAIADERGNWMAWLEHTPAGGPWTMHLERGWKREPGPRPGEDHRVQGRLGGGCLVLPFPLMGTQG